MRLKRTRQCEHCPWRKDCDPNQIPHGYSEALHHGLRRTIADMPEGKGKSVEEYAEQLSRHLATPLVAMSCHEHDSDEEVHCVGWLMNQLGEGNNVVLRMKMADCENVRDVVLVGEQHACFDDTLPKKAGSAHGNTDPETTP